MVNIKQQRERERGKFFRVGGRERIGRNEQIEINYKKERERVGKHERKK